MRTKLPPEIGTVYLEGAPCILDYETAVVVSVLNWDGDGGLAVPRGRFGPVPSFAHGKQRLLVREETGEERQWQTWGDCADAQEGETLSTVLSEGTNEVWMVYNHDRDRLAIHPEAIGKRRLIAASIIPSLISGFIFLTTLYFVSTSDFSGGIKAAVAAFGCALGVAYLVAYPFSNMRLRNREIERYEVEYAPKIAEYLRARQWTIRDRDAREIGVP